MQEYKNLIKNPYLRDHNQRRLSLEMAAMVLAVLLAGSHAYADDEPFDLDTSHWMSFDHYKDANQRGNLDAMNLKPPPKPEDAPVVPAATDKPSTPAAVAAPSRPIDLPLMPGLNKGFSVHVDSTEDDHQAAVSAPVVSETKAPDIHLSDKNWQSPSSSAVQHQEGDNGDNEDKPLNVRLSFLPDKKIAPIPSPDHGPTAQQLARQAIEKGMGAKKKEANTESTPKSPEEAAACAAIDAYKQQQLTAIQSDRQTLQALQSAISALGLQKQLDFMSGANGAINTAGASPQPKMDMPATTVVR